MQGVDGISTATTAVPNNSSPANMGLSRLRLPSTWRRIPTERRSLQGGELEARARALSYLRLAQWLPKPPAAGRRFDWACLADMPVEAPASLANDLGGDAALASLAWTEVRCCLVDPKHRQGLTVFMRLVTECGIDPLLVDAEQLQQHVGAACRNIQSAKTAKQAHCQLPHIFDALGRHLPSISISSQLDGQLWPRGVRPFALTQLRRVDPVNPVTAAVKQAITAAAASAAAAAAAVGSDQLMAGGSLITSAAAPSASRKVAVSAAVMGVQYLACLGKGIDFYMRLTRPVAGAALTSRSLQPQQPGAPPLAQAPVTSKEQAANALRMALLHLLRLYEAARPLNAAVRLRHADLWTYFGSTQIYLLSLVYLDPAVTAELLTSSRPSKLVTSTWQGKGKQQSLLRQRHALPAAYNVMDLIECYVIVCRLLIELADGVLPGAAGRVADEQRSSLPLQQDLQSEEEEEEGDDDEQQSAADAAQLLEQLAAFVDAPTATAAMPTGVTYEQQQQQPQQQQQQQPAASPAHLEALVFGPRFCASTASRGTHCPALAHCGLYTTRRAAAQEMVHHHVPPAIIRILMGHSFNSNMYQHYATNNAYLTAADGVTQLQLGTDLGGAVLKIGQALTLSLLPPGVAHQQQPITVQRLVLDGGLPAHLAAKVAPVAEEVRLALAGPDAATRAAAALSLQQRIQQHMAADREALAADSSHLTWVQRAVCLNMDNVQISSELISPLPELQQAVDMAQSRLRRWFMASSGPGTRSGASGNATSTISSSSSHSNGGGSGAPSVPPLVVCQFLPFLLGNWSLAHAHLRNPSGEPSPQLQALLDACHAAQALATTPADAAIQAQQAPGAPPVIIQGAQIRVVQPAFCSNAGAARAAANPSPPVQPPPEAAAAAARLRKAGHDLVDAVAALSNHAVNTSFPALMWGFAALAGDPAADRGALQQAAADLLQQARAAGDSVVQQGVARIMTSVLAQKAAAGQMELEQQRVAGFLESSVQQQAAAQLAGVQLAAAADVRECERQQQRLAVRERRVAVNFQEQAVRGMQGHEAGGSSGGKRKATGEAGAAGGSRGKKQHAIEQQVLQLAEPDVAAGEAGGGVRAGTLEGLLAQGEEWLDSRPGMIVDDEWYLQIHDTGVLQVAGQLVNDPATLQVQLPGRGTAYVWMFRVEAVQPLRVRFYMSASRQLESGGLQLRAAVEPLRVVRGMRLILAPSEPGEVLTELSEEQHQELLDALVA